MSLGNQKEPIGDMRRERNERLSMSHHHLLVPALASWRLAPTQKIINHGA